MELVLFWADFTGPGGATLMLGDLLMEFKSFVCLCVSAVSLFVQSDMQIRRFPPLLFSPLNAAKEETASDH